MLERIERLAEAGLEELVVVSTDCSLGVHPAALAYDRDIDDLLGTFLPRVETRLGSGLPGVS